MSTASGRVRLFCLPHAGGGPAAFAKWRRSEVRFDVVPVRLPGRSPRRREPLIARMPELVEYLADRLAPQLGTRFALFGHSMGAVVAFELARRFEGGGMRPVRLFLSGRSAPDAPSTVNGRMSDDDIRAYLRRLGATPEQVLENDEIFALFAPIVRADLQLLQHYRFVPDPRITCPVTVMYGEEDGLCVDEGTRWRQVTTGPFATHRFPGGHFFIFGDQTNDVLQAISTSLLTDQDARST